MFNLFQNGGDMDSIVATKKILEQCTLAGATAISARYAALNFYQQQQDEPLSREQIQQIADTVMAEIGVATNQLVNSIYKIEESN